MGCALRVPRLRARVATGAGLALAALALAGQTATPAFSAVTLTPARPLANGGRGGPLLGAGGMSGGRVVFQNATLLQLIEAAWNLDRDERVLGGPGWLGADRFDLRATANPATSDDQMQALLQALLAERFGLKAHVETRPFPGYALVAAKGKPRIKPSAGGDPGCQEDVEPLSGNVPDSSGGPVRMSINDMVFTVACRNVGMQRFSGEVADMLANNPQGGPPVLDNTGLSGTYDFDLKVEAALIFNGGPSGPADRGAALGKLLDSQIGLALEPLPVPLSVLVVDGVHETIAAGAAPPLPPPPAEFDVVSVKPTDPASLSVNTGRGIVIVGGRGVPQLTPGGEYSWNGASLQQMILYAYDMTLDRLAGAPAWLNEDHWTLTARTNPGLIADDTKGMLRQLLQARFGLRAHTDTQTVEVYTMTRGDRKVTLKPAAPGERSECTHSVDNGALLLTCTATTMAQLADQLPGAAPAYFTQHHAVDQTGIIGSYDFTLRWIGAGALRGGGDGGGAAGEPAAPGELATTDTIFQTVEKQLGVKVALGKAPQPVLVIDHVERTPTEQ